VGDELFCVVFVGIGFIYVDVVIVCDVLEECLVVGELVFVVNMVDELVVEWVFIFWIVLIVVEYLVFVGGWYVFVVMVDMMSYCEVVREVLVVCGEILCLGDLVEWMLYLLFVWLGFGLFGGVYDGLLCLFSIVGIWFVVGGVGE